MISWVCEECQNFDQTFAFDKTGEIVGSLHLGERFSEQLNVELWACLMLSHQCVFALSKVGKFSRKSFGSQRNESICTKHCFVFSPSFRNYPHPGTWSNCDSWLKVGVADSLLLVFNINLLFSLLELLSDGGTGRWNIAEGSSSSTCGKTASRYR